MLKLKHTCNILVFVVSVTVISGCNLSDPSYPDRPGKIVSVSSVEDLRQAVQKAEPFETILIEDGIYRFDQSLLIENKAHITLCSASKDSASVILIGDGWGDFYKKKRGGQCVIYMMTLYSKN